MKNESIHLEKKYKGRNNVSSIFMALSILFGILSIFIAMGIVGLYSMNELTKSSILQFGGAIVLCQLLKALFYAFSIHKAHVAAYSSLVDIRLDIIAHLKRLPIRFFHKRKTGDLTNIVQHDVEQVEVFLAHAFPEIIAATFIPAVLFIGLLFIDWRLAFALASTVPIKMLLMKGFHKLWGSQFAQYNISTKKMSEDLLEYIGAIPAVKAFSKNEFITNKVLSTMEQYTKWVKKMTISITIPMGVIGLFVQGGLVVLAIMGSWLLSRHEITSNQFVTSIIVGGIFISTFAKIATFQHKRIVFGKTTKNINTILGVKPEENAKKSTVSSATDIQFENITFSYNR